uniref:Uncharacterized protein n=1 Tax=Anguilla anguilla TaxID=7936 RepID=A0A0E9VE23_ANGAN
MRCFLSDTEYSECVIPYTDSAATLLHFHKFISK